MRSREEEEELERRTKKVKENHSQGIARFPSSPRVGGEKRRGGGGKLLQGETSGGDTGSI